MYPTEFVVYASNTKNSGFKKISDVTISRQGGEAESKKVNFKPPKKKARYYKVHIKNHKKLPDWHPSAGNPSWLFVDEIYLW